MAADLTQKINWADFPGLLEAVRAALPRAADLYITPHYQERAISDPRYYDPKELGPYKVDLELRLTIHREEILCVPGST